jgi:peptidyl-prolyl cis-trans isomerase SurA
MMHMVDLLIRARGLLAAALIVLAACTSVARAQQVVVIVNGDPITALDIEQRSKLTQLSTHKTPPRQEVVEELISERLKVREGKRWGLEITSSEVDSAYATMAGRMRQTPEQLTQALAKAGINASTLKAKIKADMTWQQLVRGRFGSFLQVQEKDVLVALEGKSEEAVGYDYTLRPILFIVPPGSSEAFIDGRRREAEALRGRFQNCEEGIPFARALKDVAVRDQVIRSSADLPAALRKMLESIEVGRLTAPEVTKFGVEVFAVCARKESSADNTPGKRQARESVFAERFELKSKQYLQEIRRSSMIEYR